MTKILLVEDDKSLREIYGVRLLAEGYDIVSAGDGEEALAMAIKERPQLILSDVMMPKISGFDMLDILRSTTETKDVKVIIMTALSSEDQRKRGEQLGADRYLVKSQVGIEDVVRAVHEALGDLPGVGTNPVPVSQPAPAHTPEPQAPALQPITRPDVSSLSPQPQTAPTITPTLPTANQFAQQTQQTYQPQAQVSQPVQQPEPVAMPTPPAQPTTLPQPTAPFSSSAPRPSGLGDRIIQPLPADSSQNSVDISQLMARELDTSPASIAQPANPVTPPQITQTPVGPQVGAETTQQPQTVPTQTPEASQLPQPPSITPEQ